MKYKFKKPVKFKKISNSIFLNVLDGVLWVFGGYFICVQTEDLSVNFNNDFDNIKCYSISIEKFKRNKNENPL